MINLLSRMGIINLGGPGSGRKPGETIHDVYIHKDYFPREIRPTKIGKEDFEQWKVPATSRQEAADKIWSQHGERLLGLMGPKLTRLPRIVRLHVSNPKTGVSGRPGRLYPLLVYKGD